MQGEPEEEDVPVRTRSCGYSEKVGYSSLKITPPPFLKNTPKKQNNKEVLFFKQCMHYILFHWIKYLWFIFNPHILEDFNQKN